MFPFLLNLVFSLVLFVEGEGEIWVISFYQFIFNFYCTKNHNNKVNNCINIYSCVCCIIVYLFCVWRLSSSLQSAILVCSLAGLVVGFSVLPLHFESVFVSAFSIWFPPQIRVCCYCLHFRYFNLKTELYLPVVGQGLHCIPIGI